MSAVWNLSPCSAEDTFIPGLKVLMTTNTCVVILRMAHHFSLPESFHTFQTFGSLLHSHPSNFCRPLDDMWVLPTPTPSPLRSLLWVSMQMHLCTCWSISKGLKERKEYPGGYFNCRNQCLRENRRCFWSLSFFSALQRICTIVSGFFLNTYFNGFPP